MKTLLGFCILAAFLSMPLALLLNPMLESQPFAGYKAEFIGQEEAVVGELCRFLAEGDIVRWECLPHTSDSESYGDHNENFVISFRSPGTYNIIAAIYQDGDLTIHSQKVTVGGVVDPIDPAGPDFDPELAGKVANWARKYSVDSETCRNLASNFSQVARDIKTGSLSTPSEIISRTAELNSGMEVPEGLMAELQAYLTSQSDLGSLKTAQEHLLAWNSIAKGLLDASN